MSKKVYDEQVEVAEELDVILKKTFVNHLLVYNYCLHCLYKDPEIPFHTLKKIATNYITEKNISPVIDSAVNNELYYQHKKFRKNIKILKQLTDIQYFTFTVGSYTNSIFTVSTCLTKIKIKGVDGDIVLSKPLPVLDEEVKTIYLNFSYSGNENAYRVNLYVSKQ